METNEMKEAFSQNLQFFMDKYGKDRNAVCDDLGIKYTTFTDWLKGNTYPRIDKIELLANYFNISKSSLIEPMEVTGETEKLRDMYANFAQQAQDQNIDPNDIAMALRIIGESKKQK